MGVADAKDLRTENCICLISIETKRWHEMKIYSGEEKRTAPSREFLRLLGLVVKVSEIICKLPASSRRGIVHGPSLIHRRKIILIGHESQSKIKLDTSKINSETIRSRISANLQSN
ncbi:hypothetical protein M5K25_007302 [Dendrobium thyrsiflorum]|uniref:Uncharacterized protein n=1 Tax=Dendrobium thyrsiflorum TaxID=117978 RepID=A0ABD0VE05_DENTH